tara:strand:- start:199 stop:474 length:276 start_codon:yes stop_codon:yes gene_type:complete
LICLYPLFINKKRGFTPFFDQLSSFKILTYPEQENTPAKIFLKIGACPSAYKKKLDEAIVKAILDDLLIFKFETFVKAEFIFKYFIKRIIT